MVQDESYVAKVAMELNFLNSRLELLYLWRLKTNSAHPGQFGHDNCCRYGELGFQSTTVDVWSESFGSPQESYTEG